MQLVGAHRCAEKGCCSNCDNLPVPGSSVLATTALPSGVSFQWLGFSGVLGSSVVSRRVRSADRAACAAAASTSHGTWKKARVLLHAGSKGSRAAAHRHMHHKL